MTATSGGGGWPDGEHRAGLVPHARLETRSESKHRRGASWTKRAACDAPCGSGDSPRPHGPSMGQGRLGKRRGASISWGALCRISRNVLMDAFSYITHIGDGHPSILMAEHLCPRNNMGLTGDDIRVLLLLWNIPNTSRGIKTSTMEPLRPNTQLQQWSTGPILFHVYPRLTLLF